MKDSEINIAIAEWCGWMLNPKTAPDGSRYGYPPNGLPRSSSVEETIPNFCADLNAMEQAEEGLNGEEWAEYFQRLQLHGRATGVRATAPERAEQLLRTLSLWKE